MNWLLIIVLGIIILNALIGRKVGLIKIIFSLFSFIIALILTVWISPTVNGMLKNNEAFYEKTAQKVEDMIFEEQAETKDEDDMIEGLPLPKSIKESLQENKAKQEDNIKAYITAHVTEIVINALAFVLTFVVVFVGLWIISIALNIISKLPILNQLNKMAGLLVGGLQGVIVVWILFILITVFSGSDLGMSASQQIEDSIILSFLYDKNFLLHIVLDAVNVFTNP
ncbi:MAG: CvpA family protein [Anaerolineaceae bacterium]|nr:MAG: CvpA family protein [Anaerolineaceae bacterium]